MFDGKFMHGGLVDRLKGIIAFYQFALQSEANFKIYFKSPFELSDYLNTNKLNWIANESDLKWNPFNTRILYLMDNFKIDFNPSAYFKQSKKNRHIIYSNVDYFAVQKSKLTEEESCKLWSASFNQLFRKSDIVKQALNLLLPKEKFVSIHTRFTSLMGDFKDVTDRELPENRKTQLLALLLNECNKIAAHNPGKMIFVFSDSPLFLGHIKANSSFHILDGTPIHIDTIKGTPKRRDVLKVFIDFFALAASEKIYQLKSKEMYLSSFSAYAAKVNQVPYEVVQMEG